MKASEPVIRPQGLSVRLKLTLSYVGFLMVAGVLLLAAVWVFLLRGVPARMLVPRLADFPRALDPTNFGPAAFGPAAVLVLAFLLVFGLVGGWILAGRMLAPLAQITAATRQAATGSLSHRIALDGPSDEFRELADAFDAMLARLDAHVAEQQRFAANASHELRTPLAITQTMLDVARQDADTDPVELVDRLSSVNARAIALTEALLLLSRAGQDGLPREPVDLSLIAEQAAESLLPLAERRGVRLETSGEPVSAHGSPALLQQLATNLVQNAIVHNQPAGGSVWVTTSDRPNGPSLTVENTGAALSPELLATLDEPFVRGGERVRTDQGGVGLGLTIAKRIVAAHDGTLTLSPRAGGGLAVSVQLPG